MKKPTIESNESNEMDVEEIETMCQGFGVTLYDTR